MDYILPVVSGIAIAIQLKSNAYLASKIGNPWSTFFNYTMATLTVLIIIAIQPIHLSNGIEQLPTIPFIAYLGSIIGVVCLLIVNTVFQKITLMQGALLMLLGQTIGGFVLDFSTGNAPSFSQISGALLILVGAVINSIDTANKTN